MAAIETVSALSDKGMKHSDDHSSRRLRLQTLIRLRWLAICGQGLTVALVSLGLGFDIPLVMAAILIASLAGLNMYLTFWFPAAHRLTPRATLIVLSFDLIQLSALLFITGGLANPFAPLICVPVVISFASQPIRYSMALIVIALMATTLLAFSPFSLPWMPGEEIALHPVMQLAVWSAIATMMGFAAFYTHRVSREAIELADALTATELVLQRQKHLSQLDGLAAAAAHELGTPLATISVVAKEMERGLAKDDPLREDVMLLRSQSERCRDILRRLTTLSTEGDTHMRNLPLSSMIEEVIAPHRDAGVDIVLVEKSERAKEPTGIRNDAVTYGLGNLVENAVDYAQNEVTITVEHDAARISITIEDDGEGYPPDILARIGEPYVTSRNRDDMAGGLGLGLFIAKTLLERSGASLRFENKAEDDPGARIIVSWPRYLMETKAAI
ncbi:ActS/PrrB/RegB family redox-sensitive histidine kinase [Rhizobium sp. NRK18]|uniref:ActS/PrrB/RegB family redox-sensitive histidine kinase n=1 Tax=Rhizobium sp. NRK18 TaxID=2964667 RepID=UPI003965AD3F